MDELVEENRRKKYQKLIDDCTRRHVEIPDYVLNCENPSLKERALLILAKDNAVDNDKTLAKCMELYKSVRAKQLEQSNKNEIDSWKLFRRAQQSF